MDDDRRFEIIYTAEAEKDLLAKAEHIEKVYHDPELAYTWYMRLRNAIQQDLSFLPKKYPLYDVSPWNELGIHVFIYRNDIILYSVQDDDLCVAILAAFTKGKDLSDDVFRAEKE